METDGDDSLDMIRYDKFLTVMTDVLMNRKLLNFYLILLNYLKFNEFLLQISTS